MIKARPNSCLVLLFVLGLTYTVFGQLQVTATFPANQALAVEATAGIEIHFDNKLDPATINTTNIAVFGRWSGPATLSFTLINGDSSILINPLEAFFAGEWISVNIHGILSDTGMPVQQCYAFNFWIATSPGTLSQIPVDTIYLRQGTETFIQAYGAYAGDLNNDGYSDLTVINEKF